MKQVGQNLRQLAGKDAEGNTLPAPGLTIDVKHDAAFTTARKLQGVVGKDYFAFVSDQSFGIGDKPDQVSVLRTTDPYEALRVMGTNGWNYDISPEMVAAQMRKWDSAFGLIIEGVGFDWLQASFKKQPADMQTFAKEVYEFCPDAVDQGIETVEALASEMKRTNSLYLWWD